MKPIALAIFGLVAPLLSLGQKIEFERHSLQEGLSNPSVQCILQDQKGFIWMGTLDGLNRWDGYSFTTYRNDPNDSTTLSHSCIWSIYQDKKGRLWVGTLFGLNLFDPKTKTFQRYHTVPEMAMPQEEFLKNSIRAITETDSGQLVVGTWGDGIRFFDTNRMVFVSKKSREIALTSDSVFSFASYKENLWVSSAKGITHVNFKKGSTEHYKHNPNDPGSLSHDYAFKVYTNRNGNLWVGTGDGLNRFDARTKTFERFYNEPGNASTLSDNSVQTIFEDRRGRVWVGTRDGLNLFNPITKSFKVYKNQPNANLSLSDNFVVTIFEEASGHLIIGTHGNGINVLNGRSKKFTSYTHDPAVPTSLSSNIIWSIYKDSREQLWIGTNNGVSLLNSAEGTFDNDVLSNYKKHMSPNVNIMSIGEDAEGRLWLGTSRLGAIVLNHTTKTAEHYQKVPNRPSSLASNDVTAINKDKRGNLWLGTYGALSLFNPTTKTFTHYRSNLGDSVLRQNYINSIQENSLGQLWLGLHTGASLFDPVNKTFTNYTPNVKDTTTLSSTFVMHILEDSKQRTWFGTDHGLNLLNPNTQKFNTLHYGGREFPGDYFYEILEDNKGRLWSGTNKGLICFTPAADFAPDKGRWGTIKNYTQADGIQHNEFNVGAFFKDNDGTMYLGGINGFTVFHPDSIEDDQVVPPVFISGLEIFNRPIQPGKNYNGFVLPAAITETDKLVLSYLESVFTLAFGAQAYARAKEFKYAYQLQNFDEDWNYVDADRRFATYTNLDPGTYVFRVKAANTDGVWSDQERTLTIVITPPWWGTWWFRSILVLSLFGVMALILYYRTRRIRNANIELTHLVNQKTTELTEKNEELTVQTALLEQKNSELERAKGQLEFEMQYQHQRQLLKLSIDVQEDERKRIAKDLHDELGAVLSIARMHLVHMEGQHPKEVTLEGLQQARTLTENALVTMRRISHELMPLQLQKYGLIKTLEALAKQVTGAKKVHLELITPEYEIQWSKPAELGLYRVLMEMLNNTLKHSNANHVQITLNQSLDHIVVTYADNGTGLPEDYSKGLGLQNIDARIIALGGTFEIVNEKVSGFNARIVIPL